MTSSWILNITNYTLTCAQVSDVSLEAIRADEHPVLLVICLSLSLLFCVHFLRDVVTYLAFLQLDRIDLLIRLM